MKKTVYFFATLLMMTSCMATSIESDAIQKQKKTADELKSYSRAYFASGCFWCVEAVFESVDGVVEAVSGYAGGQTDNPTYRSIGTGKTGHAEAVEVYYDSKIISFETLLRVYYGSHDASTVQGQGPDFGSQYRSIIFYQNKEEKKLSEQAKNAVAASGEYDAPVVTEIVPFEKFYPAEDYHQDYEKLHPNEGYVKAVSIPRLNRFKAKFPDLLKSESH